MGIHVKNEVGKQYGPWIVDKLMVQRYSKNGMARFKCHCRNCGYKKTYFGNGLRYGHYSRSCERCGET